MSSSLWPHESQHARTPCPSPTPRVHPNPCPSSQWCHPTISFSVIPFSACPQSFPAPRSFPMSSFFSSGGQSIAVSALAPVLAMIIQSWFPLGLTGVYIYIYLLFQILCPCGIFSSVQSLSRVWLFVTPWIAARQASLSITNSRSSLRLMSIESVMPSNHLILCHPSLILPPIPPSIRVFSNVSTLCMRWPKYWSFSFSIISSKEIPGLISFTEHLFKTKSVFCCVLIER